MWWCWEKLGVGDILDVGHEVYSCGLRLEWRNGTGSCSQGKGIRILILGALIKSYRAVHVGESAWEERVKESRKVFEAPLRGASNKCKQRGFRGQQLQPGYSGSDSYILGPTS